VALVLEIADDDLSNGRVIFDDEHAHGESVEASRGRSRAGSRVSRIVSISMRSHDSRNISGAG
jgi:hypothetical protein